MVILFRVTASLDNYGSDDQELTVTMLFSKTINRFVIPFHCSSYEFIADVIDAGFPRFYFGKRVLEVTHLLYEYQNREVQFVEDVLNYEIHFS